MSHKFPWKNLILLLMLIFLFSILARVLTSPESIADYAQRNRTAIQTE